MPRFRVEVTGGKDMDYEVEAEDQYEAESIAEDMFQQEFGDVMWSDVNAWDAEEIKDETESDGFNPASDYNS